MEKKTIGVFIAALRKANGLTQQELADRLNISNKAVSRWERDECAPDLTLIPVLAEIFGVTCDELLKGQRMKSDIVEDGHDAGATKQVKYLINREVSSFRDHTYVNIAVAIIGYITMLGISYGSYRPVIGFAVMMLFAASSLVLTLIYHNKMKDVKRDNVLFESASETLKERYDNALVQYSYNAFFVVVSVIVLSLPLLLCRSVFVNSVLAIDEYLKFFGVILLGLFLLYGLGKKPYRSLVLSGKMNVGQPLDRRLLTMNLLQLGAVAISSVLYLIVPGISNPEHLWLSDASYILALLFLLINPIVFFVFRGKYKDYRQSLTLSGIRNLLLIASPICLSESNDIGFWSDIGVNGTVSDPVMVVEWYPEYIWFAIGAALVIFSVFKIIDLLRNKT